MSIDQEIATRLEDQWAVVTGASKGIGYGIAERFVDAGANVVIVARGAVALDAAASTLRERPGGSGRVETVAADTSDPAAIADVFARVDELTEHLDVFVANSGAGVVTPFIDIPIEEWRWTLDLNLTGTFVSCQQAARRMVASDRPNRAILVVSSIRALGVRPGRLAYAVTKAGLNQLVRVAAHELAPSGVRVNALSPGITATPMALEGNPEIFAAATDSVPMGRAGHPADMGEAALYLCSPAARFVTGANLVVDGGESLW